MLNVLYERITRRHDSLMQSMKVRAIVTFTCAK